jgi:GntR family transcriptional regulator
MANGKVLPKYYQVEQLLRRRVAQMQPGDGLPSEPEMAREYTVSRATIRAAIDVLAQDGLVSRVQGRGTFVAQHKLEFPLGYYPRTDRPADDEQSVHEVIRFATRAAGPEWSGVFAISPSEKVLEVTRLTRLHDVPMGVGSLHMPAAIIPGVKRKDFAHGRFFYTLTDLGVRITRYRLSIESTVVDAELAVLIGVRPGLPGLGLTRTAFAADGTALAVVEIMTRGDIAKYVMDFDAGVATEGYAELL